MSRICWRTPRVSAACSSSTGERGRSTGRERPGGGYPRSGDRARGSERTWAGRDEAPARPPRESGPQLPDSVTPEQLDPEARSQLNSLPNDLADIVARYLVAAGLADDPEQGYAYAQAAKRLAARVGVVREACGIAAYRTGLDIAAPNPAAAEDAFGAAASTKRLDAKPLLELALWDALEANEADPLPLQIHAGFGDSDLFLPRVQPGYLKPLIERFDEPNTPYLPVPVAQWRPRFSDYAHLERLDEAEAES